MPPTFADPMQLWLEISASTQDFAWQHSQLIQPLGSRWQVYLNQLCLRTFLAWLQSESVPDAVAWPPIKATPVSWELVNGSVVKLNEKKIVLIPTDGISHDELEIPQEWVDIPSWVGDYYLAVQVNVAEGWLECWGYTTHKQLKVLNNYDAMERIYSVSAEDMVHDISALWTTIEFCPTAETQVALAPLPELTETQARNLIERAAEATFPRLSVPFAQWGGVMADERWRQQLWRRRFTAVTGDASVTQGLSLSQYLQRIQSAIVEESSLMIAAGWESIETVFGAETPQRAFSFRNNEQSAGKQAKVLHLDPALDQSVRLVLLWQLEADGRLAIRAQLHPAEGELYLPADITFSLISDQDDVLQSIQSREDNNYIQLKLFRCLASFTFKVVVQAGELTISERFVA